MAAPTLRPTPVLLTLALVVAAGGVPAACASHARAAKADGSTIVVSPDDAEKYKDPLAASQLRERALDLLAKAAADPNPQLRANSIEAMAVTPGRLRPFAAAALKDENAGVRSTAALMVGKAGLRDLAPSVRPLLNDPSPYVRASAIYALAKCGATVDPTPLADLLLSDPSPRVRAHIAFVLGEMGDPSAMGLLREAARAPMPRAAPAEVRLMQLQISEAMVKLGDERQLETIRAALYPSRVEDLEATALAVQIIGQLRDRGAMSELVYLSARRNHEGQPWPAEIRLGVAGAMARMGRTEGTFLADEYAGNPAVPIRAQAAFVYGEIGLPGNLAKLALLMGDPDGTVRVSAAAAVLRITASPAWGGAQARGGAGG